MRKHTTMIPPVVFLIFSCRIYYPVLSCILNSLIPYRILQKPPFNLKAGRYYIFVNVRALNNIFDVLLYSEFYVIDYRSLGPTSNL